MEIAKIIRDIDDLNAKDDSKFDLYLLLVKLLLVPDGISKR